MLSGSLSSAHLIYSVTWNMTTSLTHAKSYFNMFKQHYVTEVEELSVSPLHGDSHDRCRVCFVSAGGGSQQAVCAPPTPQCLLPGEVASWLWPAKDSAPRDLITNCAFSALQP